MQTQPTISDEWRPRSKYSKRKPFRIECWRPPIRFGDHTIYRGKWEPWFTSYATERGRDDAIVQLTKGRQFIGYKFRKCST